MTQIIIVVPETFMQFSQKPDLLSFGALLTMLRTNDTPRLMGCHLVAGVGLDPMEIDHAYCLAICRGLEKEFAHWRLWHKHRSADSAVVHKRNPDNVLISEPRQIARETFCSDLLLSSRSELMTDHLTGEHVQGMVVTEACRQMFLAVTECYYLNFTAPAKHYFVINEMGMQFREFLFPLPSHIHYRILDLQRPKQNRLSFHAEMEVWQSGKAVAGMNVRFTVFDGEYLAEKETSLADKVLAQCLLETADLISNRSRSVAVPLTNQASLDCAPDANVALLSRALE